METLTFTEFRKLPIEKMSCYTGIINHDDGQIEYRKNGLLHRESGPAMKNIFFHSWYKEGKCHREDGPAIIYPDRSEIWCYNGKKHRIGGPAFIDIRYESEQYWIHGQQCTKEAHDLWVDLTKLKELKSKL